MFDVSGPVVERDSTEVHVREHIFICRNMKAGCTMKQKLRLSSVSTDIQVARCWFGERGGDPEISHSWGMACGGDEGGSIIPSEKDAENFLIELSPPLPENFGGALARASPAIAPLALPPYP